jgi:membrane-associated phospholipid phosphatase
VPPQQLPMSWVDLSVPFLPNTVWFYLSEYFFFIFVYLLCKRSENLNRYFYSFLTLQFISGLIFILWPTTYPRHLFPLPHDLNWITYQTFDILRTADTPANCCPSLHVSSVYLASFMYLEDDRKKFPVFFLWATIVAVSTLTTKQHYLIDLVLGLVLAMILHLFFIHRVTYTSAKR